MQTTLKLHSLSFGNYRAYLWASLFVVGNIVVPQLFHLAALGGPTWLPIYFFTLVGAYLYGWRVGVLTALLSPLANALLFAMPAVASLPFITVKSVLLAVAAGYAAQRYGKVSLAALVGVVVFYQVLGTFGEWAVNGNFLLACQDFRTGILGMLLQIFGGYIVLSLLTRR